MSLRYAIRLRRINQHIGTRHLSVAIPRRPYGFHMGVSFAGKPLDEFDKTNHPTFPPDSAIAKWRDESLKWPKGLLSTNAGHDFFFVQEMRNKSQPQGISFAVADGVGGWSDQTDPALFSQALMYHAHRYAKGAWAGEPESDPLQALDEPVEGWELTPQECLDLAYGGVLREKLVDFGSSTACVVHLNSQNGLMRAANLGDSGFLIIRGANVFYVQPPQTHGFNCPRQLAKLPVGQAEENLFQDWPRDADLYSTTLRAGDVVIAYTDGVSDNVYPQEINSIVSLVMRSRKTEADQAQSIADHVTLFATECMWKKERVSPFERSAKFHGYHWRGGKVDDITTLVAVVTEQV